MNMNEFSSALKNLKMPFTQNVTKEMALFVYHHPDEYEKVKACYINVFSFMNVKDDPFLQVFQLLDYVHDKTHLACAYFAFHGNVELLQFGLKHGYDWNEAVLLGAVESGSLECFKFVSQQLCRNYSMTLNQVIQFIATYGTEEMLSYYMYKQ